MTDSTPVAGGGTAARFPNYYEVLGAGRRTKVGSASVKATLMALLERMGDHGNGEWTCWPSQKTLADDTEQSVRTVRSHLERICELGIVTVRAGTHGPTRRGNEYVLVFAKLVALATPNEANSAASNEAAIAAAIHTPNEANSRGVMRQQLLPPEVLVEPTTKTVSAKKPPKTKTECPTPFYVSDRCHEWFAEKQIDLDWRLETEKFAIHHRAKGTKFVDWDLAWMGWMRQAEEYKRGRSGPRKREAPEEDEGRYVRAPVSTIPPDEPQDYSWMGELRAHPAPDRWDD